MNGLTSSPMMETAKMVCPPMIDRLLKEKMGLEERLAKVNGAIAALEKHPEVAEAMNAISKINWINF